MEVEQARRQGVRCVVDNQVPAPFLLIPETESSRGNFLSAAHNDNHASEKEMFTVKESAYSNSVFQRKESDSDISLTDSHQSLKGIPRLKSRIVQIYYVYFFCSNFP